MQWTIYFLKLCDTISLKSACLSRSIGCLLVKDNDILASGYNGPPRGYPHCIEFCPRHKAGPDFLSLDNCPAVHAEANTIINAARHGVDIKGATLYTNDQIPCKWCAGMIINSGIAQVIHGQKGYYDELSKKLFDASDVDILECSNYNDDLKNELFQYPC